jgi:hypothetical protein
MIKKTINNMEKINIAEILKDCPSGMELDCVMYDNVVFECVKQDEPYPIIVKIKEPPMTLSLSKTGGWNSYDSAKCVIFPKGKTTWNEFVPPCKFKDGDIVYVKTINHHEYILIFKEIKNDQIHKYVCFTYQRLSIDKCPVCQLVDAEIMRLATEEEKAKLLKAIKENGYHWNADTKTLEKLVIKPKFQVGDCVWHHKYGIGDITQMIWIDNEIVYETHFCDTHFVDFTTYCKSNELRKYELSPNKFDVSTLQPFDKVLVRGFGGVWGINIFGFYDGNNKEYPFYCIGQTATGWNQCVPYWKNEHLLGTTDDCDDFYKTWE